MGEWNVRNVVGGLLFGAVGLFFFVGAFELGLGRPLNMGPGYFPMLFGALMMGLSALLLGSAVLTSGGFPEIRWRPLAAVLGSILAFAIAFRYLGLIPAVLLTVAIAALGDQNSRLLSTMLLAVILATGAWLIFRVGLELPMPAFRRFF